MTRYVTLGGVAVLVLAVLFGVGRTVPTSSAADRDRDRPAPFNNMSIKGVWGFGGGPGVLLPSPTVPEAVPIAGVGTVAFDGAGGCSVTNVINVNGTKVGPLMSDECTYSVNADGTGESVARFSEGPILGDVPVSFVIVDGRKEIHFIQTAVIVGHFVGKRQ